MNKSALIICALLLSATCGFSQNTKGFSVPKTAENNVSGKTYALIVGVAKYRNTAIPSLQFADKDAVEFYEYLKESGVDTANMLLLLNEGAKNSDIMISLDEMTDKAQKGDKIFIYFSGHGDVESKVITQDAYLLSYDAPNKVYAGGGAIAVYLLKGYLATLSSKGVQVIFITDACHSGNLSGGREGMENAANVLKGQWKDEIKILSCQPGELSLEGKQWGNGRGLFSYELINGMAGIADKNKDGKVSLRELNLYLMEKVPDEANPMPQNPILAGNMETFISTVNIDYLKNKVTTTKNLFAAVDTKGMEDGMLKNLPDSIKHFYVEFKKLLERRPVVLQEEGFRKNGIISLPDSADPTHYHNYVKLINGNGESALKEIPDSMLHYYAECIHHYDSGSYSIDIADGKILGSGTFVGGKNTNKNYLVSAFDYLQKIPENNDTKLLRSMMSRNLAAHEINGINDWIEDLINDPQPGIFISNPMCGSSKVEIESLYQLLGREKLYKMGVLPKLYFTLSSYSIIGGIDSAAFGNFSPVGEKLIDSAISIDSNASYTYFSKAYKYYLWQKNYDSAIKYAKKAISISPNFFNCYKIIAECYKQHHQYDSSNLYLNRYREIISNIPKEDFIKWHKKIFTSGIYTDTNRHEWARAFYCYPIIEKYKIFCLLGKEDSVQKYFKLYADYKDPYLDSATGIVGFYNNIGDDFYNKKEYTLSITQFSKAINSMATNDNSGTIGNYYNIACCYSLLADTTNALFYLEESLKKGIEKGANDYAHLQIDTDLINLRSTPAYKALMKKYFPNDYKE